MAETAKVELTDKRLRGLAPAPEGQRYEVADLLVPGLRVRVSDRKDRNDKAIGVSFVLYGRFPPATTPTRRKLGSYPAISLADARELARAWKLKIKSGTDPAAEKLAAREAAEAEKEAQRVAKAEAAKKTFDAAADAFLRHYADKKGLRSAPSIRRTLELHVRPSWGSRAMSSIRRSDLTALLDDIEEKAGPVAADKVLANLSKLFNWWATREDSYSSPIVKGMGRTVPGDRARLRVLTDAELKVAWRAAGDAGAFGGFIRLSLLTAQRRAKVAGMRWADVADDGTWTIPTEAREKSSAGELVLSPLALAVIKAQTKRTDNPYVFAGRGKAAIAGFSKAKLALDARIAKAEGAPLEPWTLHDLRRTAKTLMARAGVRPHISERVLGHAITGVEGIYDRHEYRDEKADALKRLAGLIANIIAERADNVVRLEGRA